MSFPSNFREDCWAEVNDVERPIPEYLCLTELLDQDLSAYEYFHALPPDVQDRLKREDDISSFEELQSKAADG